MGAIIEACAFSSEKYMGLLKPIIYCSPNEVLENTAVSINKQLAEILVTLQPNRRTMRLEQCFNQVLSTLPNGVTIKDFDVLFNPEYKVDLLKIMIAACKNKPFNIVWPGKCDSGKLVYAEEGYPDYKVFNIEDYDVTCIV